MSEYLPYNPANLTPEHLFRPPTGPLAPELGYLTRHLADRLTAGRFFRRKDLRVGAEFEIVFFDGTHGYDPVTNNPPTSNPNYQPHHQLIMRQIENEFDRLHGHGPFLRSSRQGRLMIEFRTAPLDISAQPDVIERLRQQVVAVSRHYQLLPTVYSQHLHVSLTKGNENYIASSLGKDVYCNPDRFRPVYSHLDPLVTLPEEFDQTNRSSLYKCRMKGDKFSQFSTGPTRLEVKSLSHEYANNPALNLFISLVVLSEYLHPRMKPACPEAKYQADVTRAASDPELISLFGASTLAALTGIINLYPAVSRREITVDRIPDILSTQTPEMPSMLAASA